MDMPENGHNTSHAKGSRVKGLSAIIVVVIGLGVMSSAPQIVASAPNVAAVISSVLVELTNADRMTGGLGTLKVNPALVAIAQAKANDMAAKSYFAHTSPEGLTPWHWYKENNYKFVYAGENLAVDFSESSDVERAWMQSPTHRANIVGTQFTEIGIATAEGTYQGRPTTFVVQEFATPAPSEEVPVAPAKPAPKATPVVAERPVRDIVPTPAPEAPALATTLPTTTPATPQAVLGESAGAYLATSAQPPRWYRIFHYFF